MKYKAHIVSHSHWDREWYSHFETYHMKLIDLVDDVLELIENDKEFKSFHLDGQMILIDDYLAIRPQNSVRLQKAIDDGKIIIGPWFVAQDCYLTSSESNVRNLQIGIQKAKQRGVDNFVGYFPDTFGITSQMIQLYKSAGIDTLIFGRGIFIGDDLDNPSISRSSEMMLEAPNGDQILGILLANWYNNAMEIPTNKDDAKKYWDERLSKCQNASTSNQLLFMNGCDHQPLQKDVTEAIKIANELYENVEFVHSNIIDYVKELRESLDFSKLETIKHELNQEYTDGMYYLTGTASSRINTKRRNFEVQNLLHSVAEPLAALTDTYDLDKFEYLWKQMLQNHAHDSICGCNADIVNSNMIARYDGIEAGAREIISNSLTVLQENIKNENENSFFVVNPCSVETAKEFEIELEIFKQEYQDKNYDLVREACINREISNIIILDINGNKIDHELISIVPTTTYELPKTSFRKSFFCNKIKIKMYDKLMAGEVKVYNLCVIDEINNVKLKGSTLKNEIYEISFDGQFNLKLLKEDRHINSFFNIEDIGDIGNTFMPCFVQNDEPILLSQKLLDSNICKFENYSKIQYKVEISIPNSANELFQKDARSYSYLANRKGGRNKEFITIPMLIEFILYNGSSNIGINIEFENVAQNHRIRANFKTIGNEYKVFAGATFDVVNREKILTRNNKLCTNQHPFEDILNLESKDFIQSFSTKGIYEYECFEDEVKFTILRATGEIGDWAYFENESSQCLETIRAEMVMSIHGKDKRNLKINELRSYFIPPLVKMAKINKIGEEKLQLWANKNSDVVFTSLVRNEENKLVVRGFALENCDLSFEGRYFRETNILGESNTPLINTIKVEKSKIFNFVLEDE